jgi:hypothetical protein
VPGKQHGTEYGVEKDQKAVAAGRKGRLFNRIMKLFLSFVERIEMKGDCESTRLGASAWQTLGDTIQAFSPRY